MFQVTVIIPVFNAEPFLEEAVLSALKQPETGEVILVEDHSQDDSFSKCEELSDAYEAVKLFTHVGRKNKGAAASRNLGIVNASCGFVAFLDADDFYLPGRFSITKKVFLKDNNVEGVYEAIGTHFESNEAESVWKKMNGPLITTVKAGIPPESIFEQQSPIGSAGHCHLNGLTLIRSVFTKTGTFDEELNLVEDVTFMMQLAACSKVALGDVRNPVAIRRVHSTNRVTAISDKKVLWRLRLTMWLSMYWWLNNRAHEKSKVNLIIQKILWDCHGIAEKDISVVNRLLVSIIRYLLVSFKEPALLKEKVFLVGVLRHIYRLLVTKSIESK